MNNGVYAKLMKVVPSLILIKCCCHSLPLTAFYAASERLPRTFLIAEIHNWFSYSSIRQQKNCDLYKAINDSSTPLIIHAQSHAKWLSIQIAVERIVNQWLVLHFQATTPNEKSYPSQILCVMYNDEKDLAFILCFNPILRLVQNINKLLFF